MQTIEAPAPRSASRRATPAARRRTTCCADIWRPCASGADVLVLGCTHYAFLRETIDREVGGGVEVIEPSEAIARQVKRVLSDRRLRNPRAEGGGVLYLCSGDETAFAALRRRLQAGRRDAEAGGEAAGRGRPARV